MSRRLALALLLIAGLAAAAAAGEPEPGPGWTLASDELSFTGSVDVGGTIYQEDASLGDLESDWDAALVRLRLQGGSFNCNGLEGGLTFTLAQSAEAEEEWIQGDNVLFQLNDLAYSLVDLHGQFGLGQPLDPSFNAALLGGVGRRLISFSRDIPGFGAVDEEVTLTYADLALRFRVRPPGHPVGISGGVGLGAVLDSEVDNDALADTLEGDGGWLFSLDAQADVAVSPRCDLSLGLAWEVQALEGSGIRQFPAYWAEWPDSELHQVVLTFTLRFKI